MNIYNYKAENVEVNDKDRVIIHYISTPDIDWEGDIVNPKGMNSQNYEKHRVILYNHRNDKPIGSNQWLKIKDEGILAASYFSKKSAFAEEIYQMHKEGVLNTWSIGWRPAMINGDIVKGSLEYDNDKGLRYINNWELVEYSSAPLAMNPNALDVVKSFGIKSLELQEEIKLMDKEKRVEERLEKLQNEIQSLGIELLHNDIQTLKLEIQNLKNKIYTSVETLGIQDAQKIANDKIAKLVAGEVSRFTFNNYKH